MIIYILKISLFARNERFITIFPIRSSFRTETMKFAPHATYRIFHMLLGRRIFASLFTFLLIGIRVNPLKDVFVCTN